LAISTFIVNINIFLLILNKLKNLFLDNNIKNNNTINLKNTKKIIQLLPCYNESEKEMLNTINSLVSQNNKNNNDNILLIVCDGKINTHNVLLNIFLIILLMPKNL
jgi:cellulose synthase/poly-beta-1,6-N-acetylglucosamine synthase-like glycosyltransferase